MASRTVWGAGASWVRNFSRLSAKTCWAVSAFWAGALGACPETELPETELPEMGLPDTGLGVNPQPPNVYVCVRPHDDNAQVPLRVSRTPPGSTVSY